MYFGYGTSHKYNDVITQIDRIYYINVDKRQDRAEFMEWWLSWQDTPYARISAIPGASTGCVKRLTRPNHCLQVLLDCAYQICTLWTIWKRKALQWSWKMT